MTRTKFTYFINSIRYGGANIGMLRLLSSLDPGDFDITVVTIIESEASLIESLPDYVNCVELNISSKTTLHRLLPLRKIIANSDIVVCSLFHATLLGGLMSAISPSTKVFMWLHNTGENSGIRKYLYPLAFSFADGVFADSDATRDVLRKWGVPEEKIEILPIAGIQADEYPSVNHKDKTGKIRIGTVGRLVPQKGYRELVDCAAQLTEMEFHIVGDGPLAEELQHSPENVILHGQISQSDLIRLWETFDIYFQPSRFEGLCMTAIEAMACGLPVVASNVDGLAESVIDGETGYLVEQGDIAAYCSKIESLAADAQLRSEMGSAGKQRVKKKYLAHHFSNKFIEAVGLQEAKT